NGRVAGPQGAVLPKDKFVDELTVSAMQPGITNRTTSVYGFSGGQIRLHKGDYLHDRNFRGQGMRIAVFDAGFVNMPNMPVFDSLYLRNRIVDTYDFVDMDTGVYDFDSHGTYVMGCLAANIPGQLMGTAPEAQYMLYRSENNVGGSENPIEEDNWVAAAERADSAGADVFNSSLIYTTFDQPSMNHPWSDMDGNTARMTIASDWAAAKGILVVNSAGNYGGGPWYKIGAAADGDSVLAVGAVDTLGQRAGFSS
ncbi:MAG: S8 family serine peptidase, partial [Bacteroidota bacterium]